MFVSIKKVKFIHIFAYLLTFMQIDKTLLTPCFEFERW